VKQASSSWSRWGRPAVAVVVGSAITAIAFLGHHEVPVLDQFDLAVHETGHLVTAFMPRLFMFLAGSGAQVLFPVAVAAYFGWRRDAAASGFCLAWAGTSLYDVSVYAGDAVRQALPLVGGGQHDWAYILGPNGFDALSHTAGVARGIEAGGVVVGLSGVILALVSAVRGVVAGSNERVSTVLSDPMPSAAPEVVPIHGGEEDPWLAAAALPFRHERKAG
jgi:hypothetical protein